MMLKLFAYNAALLASVVPAAKLANNGQSDSGIEVSFSVEVVYRAQSVASTESSHSKYTRSYNFKKAFDQLDVGASFNSDGGFLWSAGVDFAMSQVRDETMESTTEKRTEEKDMVQYQAGRFQVYRDEKIVVQIGRETVVKESSLYVHDTYTYNTNAFYNQLSVDYVNRNYWKPEYGIPRATTAGRLSYSTTIRPGSAGEPHQLVGDGMCVEVLSSHVKDANSRCKIEVQVQPKGSDEVYSFKLGPWNRKGQEQRDCTAFKPDLINTIVTSDTPQRVMVHHEDECSDALGIARDGFKVVINGKVSTWYLHSTKSSNHYVKNVANPFEHAGQGTSEAIWWTDGNDDSGRTAGQGVSCINGQFCELWSHDVPSTMHGLSHSKYMSYCYNFNHHDRVTTYGSPDNVVKIYC